MCKLRADNTSIVTVMLDPPGPPRAQVLRRLHGLPNPTSVSPPAPVLPPKVKKEEKNAGENKFSLAAQASPSSSSSAIPGKGIAIISRFPNSKIDGEKQGMNLVGAEYGGTKNNRIVHDSLRAAPRPKPLTNQARTAFTFGAFRQHPPAPPPAPTDAAVGLKEEPSSTSEIAALERLCARTKPFPPPPPHQQQAKSNHILLQCNEISSSDTESSPALARPPPLPQRRKASGPPVTRSKQTEAAPPPRKQPRLAPTSAEYNSDSENHQPQKQQQTMATRSTRQSCGELSHAIVPSAATITKLKPLSQRNSRRSEPILRPPPQADHSSPRKQPPPSSSTMHSKHANPVLTRVLRSRNSISTLSNSPASVITRGRQQKQVMFQRVSPAMAAEFSGLAGKRKRRSSAAATTASPGVRKLLNPRSPHVVAATAAGNSAKRARMLRNK
jgi:hypothetical protein